MGETDVSAVDRQTALAPNLTMYFPCKTVSDAGIKRLNRVSPLSMTDLNNSRRNSDTVFEKK